jgi:DNA-directed RNA polymerase omega subunit
MKKLTVSRTGLLDNEKCVSKIGSRFNMVLVAAYRVRELRRMHKESGKMFGPIDALLEIQEGKIDPVEYTAKVKARYKQM